MKTLKHILLVEDSSRDVELALDALEQHHLANQVVVLRDGAEALDYLHRRGAFASRRAGQPALVLLDLNLPKVDGMEVLRQLRCDPALQGICVIIMTASNAERDLFNSLNLGVNAYLVKPVNFQKLIAAMQRAGAFWGVVTAPPAGSAPENPE